MQIPPVDIHAYILGVSESVDQANSNQTHSKDASRNLLYSDGILCHKAGCNNTALSFALPKAEVVSAYLLPSNSAQAIGQGI